MKNVSSYGGVLIAPQSKNDKIVHYLTTNPIKTVLNIFAVQPSFYTDAYSIAKNVPYIEINIFAVTNNALFISDIVRLVCDLAKLNKRVKFIYPIKSLIPTNTTFELNFVKTQDYIIEDEVPFDISSVYYEKNDIDISGNLYNIQIQDGVKSIMLCSYLTESALDRYYNNENIDEIHMGYNTSLYGGIVYNDLLTNPLYEKYRDKCVAAWFNNINEYMYCKTLTTRNVKMGKWDTSFFV